MVKGDSHTWHLSLHRRYGDVVRTNPMTLSYSNGAASREIYGVHKDIKFVKDLPDHLLSLIGERGMITADDKNHTRIRRVFNNGFSDKALKLQEPLFMEYANLLVNKLNEKVAADPKAPIDMVNMLNFTTFDIMADLTFGKPLGMLTKAEYHPWVSLTFKSVKYGTIVLMLEFFPLARSVVSLLLWSLKGKRDQHHRFASEQLEARLKRHSDKPDFWNLVLQADKSLNDKEMHATATDFMGAGSETTATELSGLLYYLLQNPSCMEALRKELRDAFPAGTADITMAKLAQLRYLRACLEEGLRIYPPAAIGLRRLVPQEGASILGTFVAGGTSVSVAQFGTYRNERNFALPDEFHPERWMPRDSPEYDGRFEKDDRACLLPFSYGPRNCIGQNLAYHEMRLLLAALVLNFEFQLDERCERWNEQKVYMLWEKKPLLLRLKPIQR